MFSTKFLQTYIPPSLGIFTHGYVGGGYPTNTAMGKFVYGTETYSALSTINTAIGFGFNDIGFFNDGAITANYYKVNFSNDTFVSNAANTSNIVANGTQAQAMITPNNVYWESCRYSPLVNSMNKFSKSSETWLAASSLTSAWAISAAGITFSSTKGYSCGGITASNVSTINSYTFSNETGSTIAATLSLARHGAVGVGNASFGLICGGLTGTYNMTPNSTRIDKFTFSNETCAASSASLPVARNFTQGMNTVNSKAYMCGGGTGSGSATNAIQRIALDGTDVSTTLAANIGSNREACTATGYHL